MEFTTQKPNGMDETTSREQAQAGKNCSGATCGFRVCSPCLIVWGVVALVVLANLLLGAFQ